MPTPLGRSGSGLLQIQGPDCCLRLTAPGSAHSAPHGFSFRRGRVLFPYGLQLCSTSLRLRLSAVTGDFATGLLWRLARADFHRLVVQPLLGGTAVKKLGFHVARPLVVLVESPPRRSPRTIVPAPGGVHLGWPVELTLQDARFCAGLPAALA